MRSIELIKYKLLKLDRGGEISILVLLKLVLRGERFESKCKIMNSTR